MKEVFLLFAFAALVITFVLGLSLAAGWVTYRVFGVGEAAAITAMFTAGATVFLLGAGAAALHARDARGDR
jgi:predicted Na+-dependent transporter